VGGGDCWPNESLVPEAGMEGSGGDELVRSVWLRRYTLLHIRFDVNS
jgi:hypothetical protein